MKRRSSPRRGFTLLEVLVALVIFVGSVAVISRLISLGLDNADYSRLQSEGALLIENRFAEIDADMESSGDSDDSFPGWTCSVGEEPTGDFLLKFTATAKHTSGVSVTMTRLYFDETAAEEAAAAAASSSSSGASSTSTSSSGSTAGGS
jgi:general secretion pathway protein I